MTDLIARFEDKYMPEPNSGCWIWLGAVWKHPYGDRGKMWLAGDVQRFAYRISYELFVGPIPDGLLICHKCDTPICVNPDHLFAGTSRDNTQDMIRKGRRMGVSGPYNVGASNGMAKLSETDVRAIRADQAAASAIATKYGVSRGAIRDIKTGRNWAHVA